MKVPTDEKCEKCNKDWTKCGTCHVMMQLVKEQREKNKKRRITDEIFRVFEKKSM